MTSVLMVEDNPVDVDLVELSFAREPTPPSLVVFETAEEVLALSDEELREIDVFAIDPGLPQMSGDELAIVLRQRGIGPTLLLAMSPVHAQILAVEAECDGATAKPLTANKVDAFLCAYRRGQHNIVI